MEFNNYTPFAGIAWENVNANGEWSVSTVARVKFEFKENGLLLASAQGALFTSDEFYEEAGSSSVRYESDYVSFKENTDLIINAHAWSPNAKALTSWDCGIRIYSEDRKLLKAYGLQVRAEKRHLKAGPIWSTSLRDKSTSIPIRYEKAKGGCIKIPAKNEDESDKYLYVNPYNPIGCGIKKIRDSEQTVFSPQVLYLKKPHHKVPAGFGFINRAWKSRTDFAGTYDEKWIEKQHPLPPYDFDIRYNQAAHPQLIMDGYLKTPCTFELTNLREGESIQKFELPHLELLSRIRTHTGDIHQKMNLDTLIIDIDDEDISKHCVYASYRALTPKTQEINAAEIMLLQNKEVV
jgi:hypothetical protein